MVERNRQFTDSHRVTKYYNEQHLIRHEDYQELIDLHLKTHQVVY